MKRATGFSLVELMIVVVIIGILAAIAYPSYVDHVRKSRRTVAKSELMAIAQKQEAYYARHATYTKDMRDLGYSNEKWNSVPVNAPSQEQYYQIKIKDPTSSCALSNCYALRARRNTSTDQANDDVEWYELWSTGLKKMRIDGSNKNSWMD